MAKEIGFCLKVKKSANPDTADKVFEDLKKIVSNDSIDFLKNVQEILNDYGMDVEFDSLWKGIKKFVDLRIEKHNEIVEAWKKIDSRFNQMKSVFDELEALTKNSTDKTKH